MGSVTGTLNDLKGCRHGWVMGPRLSRTSMNCEGRGYRPANTVEVGVKHFVDWFCQYCGYKR